MKIYLICVEYNFGCPEIYMAYRSIIDRDTDLEQLEKEVDEDMDRFIEQYGDVPRYWTSECELIE